MILQSLFSLIASLSFGIIFNIKGKKLIFAGIGGGLSWFTYSLCLNFKFSVLSSLLVSSIIFSIYSEILARLLKTPVTTIIIPALIPLVPGYGMYYTMYQAITGDINQSVNTGLNTLSSAGTLAIGVILVSSVFRQLNKKHEGKLKI